MAPEAQIILFALVSLLFFMIAMFASDEDWVPAIGCTGALVAYWALNTILWMTSVVEDWSLPADIVFLLGTGALAAWMRWPWIMVLAALFAIGVALDVLRLTGQIDYETWSTAGNAVFVLQLATASFSGLVRITRNLIGRMPPSSPVS